MPAERPPSYQNVRAHASGQASHACGGDTYYLGAFALVPNTTAAVTLSVAGYAPTAEPPVVCPVMVELATGNMATADVNENGQADDCFVGDYDALLTLPMPTQPTAPYGWYGAYVTFPSDAPDYEGPADQGGIWGYWWFNTDTSGHFLHIWPFWSAGARQTAAAVVPGSQGNGAARTEPRLYANVPLRLLPVETQRAASLPMRPPLPVTIIHTTPVLEDTADIAYTRQRATLTLANMTIAIHVTNAAAPDELVYVFADHLSSATLLADESGNPIPNSAARYFPFGDWRTEPAADETSRWYTGHVHDNLSRNDLGLIYMNARFYLPGVGRFVSADTIVPGPTNPQSLNRYSYAFNDPVKLRDPSGHCAENGDEACWSFLESEFCNNDLCEPGHWQRWIIAGGESIWTITELIDVRDSLLAAKNYLADQELNWLDVLGDFRFERHDRKEAILPTGRFIQHASYPGRTNKIQIANDLWERPRLDVLNRLLHEIGHSIDVNSGRRLQASYHALGDRIYDKPYDNSDILTPYLREYGRSGARGEAWADSFAASVFYHQFNIQVPTNIFYPDSMTNMKGYQIDFVRIYSAVKVMLSDNFGP